MTSLVKEFVDIFKDVPGCTYILKHDVLVPDGVKPIKQRPYWMNPEKELKLIEKYSIC